MCILESKLTVHCVAGAWGLNRKEMQREGLGAHQSLDWFRSSSHCSVSYYHRVLKSKQVLLLEDERRLRQGRTEVLQPTANQL